MAWESMSTIAVVIDEMLKQLVDPQKYPNMTNLRKLHDAIKTNELKNVKCLVKHGADVNAVYQQETAFTRAAECKYFDCANVIMESKKFDPNAGNQFKRTPIFMASKLGRPDLVSRLLKLGAKVNNADIRGVTPLGACAWYDNDESAEILVQHGANIDQPDVVGQTPLYRACSNVSKNVVRVLLKNSCDVNLPTCDRRTPLMAALPSVYNQNVAGKKLSDMISICKMLVQGDCYIDAQDEQGRTALHHTVENDDVYGTCFLAEHGSDLEVKDNSGYTPFHTAILPRRPRYEVARYLLHYGANGRKAMLNPNEEDDPVISPLAMLLISTPNRAMNMETKWSRTMLLRTLSNAVFPHGVNIRDHVNKFDWARDGNLNFHKQVELDIVKWLNGAIPCTLEHQTRIKIRDFVGKRDVLRKVDSLPIGTALKRYLNLGLNSNNISLVTVCQLHCAIQDKDNQLVKKLLKDHRMNTTVPLNNRNALTLAIETGNNEAAIMVLENQGNIAQPSILTPSQDSALHIAAKYGRTTVLKELVKRNGDIVNSLNAIGYSPLQEAILAGQYEAAVVLIENKADINVFGHGVSIIHLAAASGATKTVELLLERGWDANAVDIYGNTPLHVAANKGAEYLCRHINLPALYQDEGTSVIDYIHMMETFSGPALTKKISGHISTVETLLKAGADVTKINSQSKTALTGAEEIDDPDIINILKNAHPL